MGRYFNDELYHHGIIGQKWGIRRFQNEDGSLTPAGRNRYSQLKKKDGTSVLARKSERGAEKAFKKKYPSKELDAEHGKKMAALNSSNLGKKMGYYVKKGVIKSDFLEGNPYITSMDKNEKIDAEKTYKKYQKEVSKILNETADKMVDELLESNNYEITEEGRKYINENLFTVKVLREESNPSTLDGLAYYKYSSRR